MLVVGPSARATHCGSTYGQIKPVDPNLPRPESYGFIDVTPGPHVVVNPDQAAPWALAVVEYYLGLPEWAACETGLSGTISCAFEIAGKAQEIALSMRPEDFYFRYVYQDEFGWHVAGDQLVADVRVTDCLFGTT
ncbi:MAG: hypothetical protein M3279_11895 [Actinomycetota bacterium]|nr:hypothetical protein [Actinomycetota bacterium]